MELSQSEIKKYNHIVTLMFLPMDILEALAFLGYRRNGTRALRFMIRYFGFTFHFSHWPITLGPWFPPERRAVLWIWTLKKLLHVLWWLHWKHMYVEILLFELVGQEDRKYMYCRIRSPFLAHVPDQQLGHGAGPLQST